MTLIYFLIIYSNYRFYYKIF